MSIYPIFELELLEQWLEMKLRSLDTKASSENPLEYSDANLTKSILKFVKFMAIEQRDKQDRAAMTTYEYGLPYYSSPTPRINNSTTDMETICPSCKGQAPGATHCAHRTVYKTTY